MPPVVVPRAEGPRRHYFLFLEPIDLTELDPRDERACNEVLTPPTAHLTAHLTALFAPTRPPKQVYAYLRTAVEDGIAYLREARDADPNESVAPRIVVERLTGQQQDTFNFDAESRRRVSSSWVPRDENEVCVLVSDDAPPLCVQSKRRWD